MTDDLRSLDPAGRLRLPTAIPEPEPDHYRAFGGAEYYDAVIPCLVFRLKDGGRIAKPYHWLAEVEYDPSVGIRLSFTDATIRFRGRNLEGLFTAISDHQVRWVREADRAASTTAADADAVIDAVERGPSRA